MVNTYLVLARVSPCILTHLVGDYWGLSTVGRIHTFFEFIWHSMPQIMHVPEVTANL